MVGKIATGEIEEKPQTKSGRVLFWSVFLILGALVASPQRYLWAATEGATHPPVGTIPHFERGKAPPGFEEPEPAPIVLAEARKQAKRGAYAAIAAFDGRWSVVIGMAAKIPLGCNRRWDLPPGRHQGNRMWAFVSHC